MSPALSNTSLKLSNYRIFLQRKGRFYRLPGLFNITVYFQKLIKSWISTVKTVLYLIEKFPLLGKSREYMFIKAEKIVNLNINTLSNILYEPEKGVNLKYC